MSPILQKQSCSLIWHAVREFNLLFNYLEKYRKQHREEQMMKRDSLHVNIAPDGLSGRMRMGSKAYFFTLG